VKGKLEESKEKVSWNTYDRKGLFHAPILLQSIRVTTCFDLPEALGFYDGSTT